jgi:hypothetical protein
VAGTDGRATTDLLVPPAFVANVRDVLDRQWTHHGYTVPNVSRYPHQWLWDSCFHSLIWAELGDERAVTELASVFRHQDASGFVPHITYGTDPAPYAGFWGRTRTSSITQPPMYGHAAAFLVRRGFAVPDRLLEQARAGLRFLLESRTRVGDLVVLCHPWESGADDSPRWDSWFGDRWDRDVWFRRKGEILQTIVRNAAGSPVANPAFAVASAGFNSLVAFNALELSSVLGDEGLAASAVELSEALDGQWQPELETWIDASNGDLPSSSIRTIDALLPLLVVPREMPTSLLDPSGFATPFGPAGVHRAEQTYDPAGYWRGSSWPQITYLLAVAAARRGRADVAIALRRALLAGAAHSGLAEHWHAELGTALGAVPQAWTGVAVVSI